MKELDGSSIASLIPSRPADGDKRAFGSVLDVAGSAWFRGAALLSAESALRVGAGYVTLACPRPVADSAPARLPDAVLIPLRAKGGCVRGMEYRRVADAARRASAIALGCGLSSPAGGTRSLRRFYKRLVLALTAFDVPVVLDADGLNLLAELQPLALPAKLVMTPHERELARLLGRDAEAVRADREGTAVEAALRFGAVVVLKGHRSIVTDGERTLVNPTGNSALAKAGSGDVLAGAIAGLLAQGMRPLDAACAGAYLHGLAGEIASRELTEYGVLASDLSRYLPRAIEETLALSR
jgi:hydroxyethylthiazole kinase-like uncharacterized protein yjeF